MSRSRWRDHAWHLVHAGPQAPTLHMALDDLMLDDVSAGRRPPTLRIWEWAGPAVVMGRFQSLRNEVDAEAARRHGIEVVRRISGGGAMFIEPGNTITYSIVAPATLVDGMTFEQAYAYMDQWTVAALGTLGIKAWYQPLNDITSSAGKIAGAAQARRGRAVLHCTMSPWPTTSTRCGCSRCCAWDGRNCPTRARPARRSVSIPCAARPGCRAAR